MSKIFPFFRRKPQPVMVENLEEVLRLSDAAPAMRDLIVEPALPIVLLYTREIAEKYSAPAIIQSCTRLIELHRAALAQLNGEVRS